MSVLVYQFSSVVNFSYVHAYTSGFKYLLAEIFIIILKFIQNYNDDNITVINSDNSKCKTNGDWNRDLQKANWATNICDGFYRDFIERIIYYLHVLTIERILTVLPIKIITFFLDNKISLN